MAKCSEETLRVLRANKESLLTILEVFIHDPLYKWQLTSQRAQQRQKGDASAQDDAGTLLLPLSSLFFIPAFGIGTCSGGMSSSSA